MAEYRRGAHTVFEIHLRLVWITKNRRPALQGEVATRVRDLIRDICGQHEITMTKGQVSKIEEWLTGGAKSRGEAVEKRRLKEIARRLTNWLRIGDARWFAPRVER